jgi:uncharacterized protein
MEQFTTAQRMRDLSAAFFSPVSVSYHYLSMAKGNHAKYLMGPEVKLKKYLYVLRPLLACDWIAATGTMAPMEFHHLLERLMPDGPVRMAVDRLLVAKMSSGEVGTGPRDPVLHAWIDERLAHYAANPPAQAIASDADTARLDELMRATLEEVWR